MKVFGRHPLRLVIAAAVFLVGMLCIEFAVQLKLEHKAGENALVVSGLSCYAVAVALLWWKPAKSR